MHTPKILLCCSSAPNLGLLKHMAFWATKMKAMGINITAVSGPNEQEDGLFESLDKEGIDCYIVESLDNKFPYRLRKTLSPLGEVLRQVEPDVIHTMGIGHCVDFHFACRKVVWKPKMICTLESCRHGTRYEGLARRAIVRIANSICDYLAVISKVDEREMLRAGVHSEKLVYIPNFIDCNDFLKKINTYRDYTEIQRHFIKGNPTIVYLAQLIKRKGHVYLFKALKNIRDKYPDVSLLLFGLGDYEHVLRRKAGVMGLLDCVHFMGQIPHDYVPAILSKSDISIISSLSETFGWAIIEPILAGTPVVSTRVGIAPQVEEAGGLLGVPVRDASSIATSVLKLLQDENLKQTILNNGMKYIKEQFDIERVTKKYATLYGGPMVYHTRKANA